MKKIVYILSSSILLFFLLVNVLSLYNISFFGFRVFKVGSGSMTPFLKVGDIVVIKNAKTYKVNDVITYEENGEFITHRIISIDDEHFTAQGDANNTADKESDVSKIIGKLIFKSSLLGTISSLIFKPIFIGLITLIFIVYIFYKQG